MSSACATYVPPQELEPWPFARLSKTSLRVPRAADLGLGVNYVSVLVQPELSSAVRGLTSEADAKALYTSGRLEMQKRLKSELVTALSPRGIVIEDVLLKAVRLPDLLAHAIELKAQAEQDSARMEFVLTKERQEAERKSIEARGIASFQKIVSEGISPALLQWKGIEATEKLAASTNSKMIIMGNSKESLPVLLSAASAGEDGDEHRGEKRRARSPMAASSTPSLPSSEKMAATLTADAATMADA